MPHVYTEYIGELRISQSQGWLHLQCILKPKTKGVRLNIIIFHISSMVQARARIISWASEFKSAGTTFAEKGIVIYNLGSR